MIFCGGDHSAPIPGARALSEFHKDGKIGYMHIDCHLDSAPGLGRHPTTPTVPARSRAFDLPNCDGANMAHMGSRNGLNPKDWYDFFVDTECALIPMMEASSAGSRAAPKEIFEIAWNGTDGSIAPGTRTPSTPAACRARPRRNAFGINAREAIQIARIAGTYGADILEISELSPIFDVSQMSIKLACCMIYHYLGSRAKTLRDQGKTP